MTQSGDPQHRDGSQKWAEKINRKRRRPPLSFAAATGKVEVIDKRLRAQPWPCLVGEKVCSTLISTGYFLAIFFDLRDGGVVGAIMSMEALSGSKRLRSAYSIRQPQGQSTFDAYPDQNVEPLLRLAGQSGILGDLRISGALTLSVYASGLRVGDIFVPWENITVTRKSRLFRSGRAVWSGRSTSIGCPTLIPIGTLTIRLTSLIGWLAQLWEGGQEGGPFPEEKRSDKFRRLLAQWASGAGFFALFYIMMLLLGGISGNDAIPVAILYLFGSIVLGVVIVIRG